jgi:hypothetical protein
MAGLNRERTSPVPTKPLVGGPDAGRARCQDLDWRHPGRAIAFAAARAPDWLRVS